MSIDDKRKISPRFAFTIELLLILILIILIGFLIYGSYEGILIDNEISKKYSSIIEPEAQYKISKILLMVSNQDEEIERYRVISNWTSSFIYADNQFLQKDRFSQFSILSPNGHYYQDEVGHWFIRRGKYANDINIIAYYESGRCGEMAKIWNYTANRFGINSREVGDPSGYHAWVEFQRGDEWYYVDPSIPPSENLILWFNSTNNRNQSQLIWNAARIMAGDQDITHHYPPYGTIRIHNIGHYDSLFIRWDDGSNKHFIEPYDIRGKSILDINLTVKNYSISTTGLWIVPPMTNISVNEGKIVEIDLYNELKPIRLNKSDIKIPLLVF